MFRLTEYVAVQSLEEAYDLLMQDKNNVILGGLLWMKMGKKRYHTGIDLSGLALDRIEEIDESIEIGCMTTLRQMETHPLLGKWMGPLFSDAVRCIVGVQFRNCATLGGSVYSRFGFSDVLTALMALDTQVQLFDKGLLSLAEFLDLPRKRDILVKIIIRKQAWQTSFQSHRMSATDFPVLSAAVSLNAGRWRLAVGARPNRARLADTSASLLSPSPADDQIKTACDSIARELKFGTDQRGSRAYRKALVKVLVRRGIEAICR